jgi:hypothetical protein
MMFHNYGKNSPQAEEALIRAINRARIANGKVLDTACTLLASDDPRFPL